MSKPMRILFIVDNLGAGGAERSLQELLPEFRANGVEPIVASFQQRREGVEDLVAGANDFRVLPGSRWQQMLELRRIVQHERIELVHTTLFEADVFGRSAVLGTVPVVTSLVNMPYEPARLLHDRRVNRRKLAVVRSLEIVTGKLGADHFHAISEAVRRAAIERLWIDPARISVVLRGRDEKRLGRRSAERRARARRELGIAESTPVILAAGRQEFQKGHQFLLEALVDVLATEPSALLLIAGRAGNATAALQAAAAPLGDRVRFLGHRDDVPDLMVAADLFALPSLWEGLGCVVIEAMALELPIVASDLPPVREVVGDDALLVPPASASELARGLLTLHADRSRARALAGAARLKFVRELTIERSARGMLSLFERVARPPHAGLLGRLRRHA